MNDAPKPKSQIDKFRDLARELETDDDEKAFDERLKKLAKAQPREVVRVDWAKDGRSFTVHRAGRGTIAPIFPTQQEVRDWLADHGYSQVGDDPDEWSTR